MNNTQTLAAFYGDRMDDQEGAIGKEVAHFNVLDMKSTEGIGLISLPYSRRSYCTITLLQGNYRIEFEDESFNFSGDNLLFYNTENTFQSEITKRKPGWRILYF